MALAIKCCMFPFPDHAGGEFQVSKGIKMKAGENDRQGGGEEEGGGGQGRMFSMGNLNRWRE